MTLKSRYDNLEVKRLAKVIDIIARKCFRGIPALMGDEPQPSRERIKEALFFRPSPDEDLGTKVQGGHDLEGREIRQEDVMIDEVDCVLDAVEWREIVQAVRQYAHEYPTDWAMYKAYILAQEQIKISWGGEGAVARTAERFDTSEYILRERARSVPFKIARAVSMGYWRYEGVLINDRQG